MQRSACAVLTALTIFCTQARAQAPPAPSPLAITGNSSLIEAKRCWEAGERSGDLLVFARTGAISKVDVSTVGLGDAKLCIGKCGSCKAALPVVRIPSVSENGSQVCIVFPDHAFPDGSQLATGKIVAASSSASAEVNVSLAAASQPLWLTALVWGLGITLPAFFSGWLTLNAYRKQKQIDDNILRQAKAVDGERGNAAKRLREVIAYLSYLKGKTDAEFADGLRNQIDGLGLEGLPEDQERAVRGAIERHDRAAILDALAGAFPNFRDEIDAARRR